MPGPVRMAWGSGTGKVKRSTPMRHKGDAPRTHRKGRVQFKIVDGMGDNSYAADAASRSRGSSNPSGAFGPSLAVPPLRRKGAGKAGRRLAPIKTPAPNGMHT